MVMGKPFANAYIPLAQGWMCGTRRVLWPTGLRDGLPRPGPQVPGCAGVVNANRRSRCRGADGWPRMDSFGAGKTIRRTSGQSAARPPDTPNDRVLEGDQTNT